MIYHVGTAPIDLGLRCWTCGAPVRRPLKHLGKRRFCSQLCSHRCYGGHLNPQNWKAYTLTPWQVRNWEEVLATADERAYLKGRR